MIKTKMLMATLWTFVLITDIISCINKEAPSWIMVFCPLICIVIDEWLDYLLKKNILIFK